MQKILTKLVYVYTYMLKVAQYFAESHLTTTEMSLHVLFMGTFPIASRVLEI